MFLRIRRSNLSVYIRRAISKSINLVAFFIILAPSLAGIQSVQAATIEAETIFSKSSLPNTLLSSKPIASIFSVQQQALACSTGENLVLADGEECSLSPGTHSYTSVTVQSGGTLILESDLATDLGVILQVANLIVETGGLIDANGQGYVASEGPGSGIDGGLAGGARHGGVSGNSSNGTSGGDSYGDLYAPASLVFALKGYWTNIVKN